MWGHSPRLHPGLLRFAPPAPATFAGVVFYNLASAWRLSVEPFPTRAFSLVFHKAAALFHKAALCNTRLKALVEKGSTNGLLARAKLWNTAPVKVAGAGGVKRRTSGGRGRPSPPDAAAPSPDAFACNGPPGSAAAGGGGNRSQATYFLSRNYARGEGGRGRRGLRPQHGSRNQHVTARALSPGRADFGVGGSDEINGGKQRQRPRSVRPALSKNRGGDAVAVQIIDAGSSGSRMHVYEWEPREFKVIPPPISRPGSTNQWTQRMEPGISSFSSHPEDIPEALAPLVDFAKDILKDHEKDWGKFPIYLKATAGMRQLSYNDREAILREVREYLGNPETCPFYFAFDQARVISGEEEGIYGWAAVNFLHGELLAQSEGAGTADSSANMTVGTLDLGGASTQISFFKSDQDILANLFKLQIGGQKHWNVYTHSFLQFGLNSARLRMHTNVAEEAYTPPTPPTPHPPLPAPSTPYVRPHPDSSPRRPQTAKLLEGKSPIDNFCQFAFPGQCSLLGVYQPELPKGREFGRFYGFAGYYKLWQFLNLPEKTSVSSVEKEGRRICTMSHGELAIYNEGRDKHEKNVKYLPKYCFMSSYITTLLRDGFGFPTDEEITFVDEVQGYKVDWALGSMLYEINALPWSYIGPDPSPAVACPDDTAKASDAKLR
eukprot:jgi/Undpi1/7374/HiC_scaffold_22.g09847.m1